MVGELTKAMMVAIAEMERVPRGEIIVGANEGTCLHILPYVFADFKKQFPQGPRLDRIASVLEVSYCALGDSGPAR